MLNITETTTTIKCQGVIREINAESFHPDAINAIFVYGLRRWVQDHVNSVAKNLRDNGESVDAESLVAARIDQAVTGEITMRNGVPADPLDQYRIAALRAYMKADPDGELVAAYNDIPSDDQKARREFLLAVAAKNADTVDPAAERLKAEADARAKAASAFNIAV